MKRAPIVVLGCLSLAVPCAAQAPQGDSQTLQALLSEVRQLRQELQTSLIVSQRAQILIHRLQAQEAAVGRAAQRLEEARETLSGAQAERKQLAAEIERNEKLVGDERTLAAQRKALQDRLPIDRARLESIERTEQREQAREAEAHQQLQAEETALQDLRGRLDELDQSLETAARRPRGTSR
jgi:DNA repair exonuclease SbcCD ATPase subunit